MAIQIMNKNIFSVPVITKVNDFKHPSAPCGISFEPGESGPPRLRNLYKQ